MTTDTMHTHNRGYTLIELLVAATLLAVLSVVGVVAYTNINERSRDTKRTSDIEQLRSALEIYRSDNGYYPNANPGSWGNISNLGTALVTGGYMPALPSDPRSSQSYYYIATNLVNGQYYGYCLCAMQETLSASQNTCGTALPAECNYGVKNP